MSCPFSVYLKLSTYLTHKSDFIEVVRNFDYLFIVFLFFYVFLQILQSNQYINNLK